MAHFWQSQPVQPEIGSLQSSCLSGSEPSEPCASHWEKGLALPGWIPQLWPSGGWWLWSSDFGTCTTKKTRKWDGSYITGWWFGTCFIFPYIGNVIIPTDFHIFQRGRYTTNQITVIHFVQICDPNWSEVLTHTNRLHLRSPKGSQVFVGCCKGRRIFATTPNPQQRSSVYAVHKVYHQDIRESSWYIHPENGNHPENGSWFAYIRESVHVDFWFWDFHRFSSFCWVVSIPHRMMFFGGAHSTPSTSWWMDCCALRYSDCHFSD